MKNYGSYLKKLLLCTFLSTLLLSYTTVLAATIRIPADYPTIQTGIDAATDGDTVLVADGTYKGIGNKNLDFRGKAITVQSENGPQNCIIDCDGNGRGFYFHSGEGAQSVVSGFTITNCDDSGIECDGASPTITNCIVSGNTNYGGAGIYLGDSLAVITDCIIAGNTSKGTWTGGGGISSHGPSRSTPTVSRCKIINNTSVGPGGGIHGNIRINDSIISGNTTDDIGGGIYIHASAVEVTITNCIISDNRAENYGGGIYIDDFPSANTHITNSTISSNTSGISGAGIFSNSNYLTITNSILWGDYPDELAPFSPEYVITYSDILGGHSGTGNIDVNPQFVGDGDYHLTASSPCIDAGTSAGAPDHDIDGQSRPQGAGYDIGADEYGGTEPQVIADFSCSPTSGPAPLTVNFSDQSSGTIGTWLWDFGDGSTSEEQNPSHTYTARGTYTASLTVTGPAGSDTETKADYIKVRSPNMAMPWIPLLLLDD